MGLDAQDRSTGLLHENLSQPLRSAPMCLLSMRVWSTLLPQQVGSMSEIYNPSETGRLR